MLGIGDVRDYVAGLGYKTYCGVLPNKEEKSIGVYPMPNTPNKTVGGDINASYSVKRISILVHWNKSIRETEKVAHELYNKLTETRNETINQSTILFIDVPDEPHHIDTDEEGIYEYVIEAELYYER